VFLRQQFTLRLRAGSLPTQYRELFICMTSFPF
jgi:hypothetical protein